METLGLCAHCRQSISLRRSGGMGRPPKFCSAECKEGARQAAARERRHQGLAERTCQQCGVNMPVAMSTKARFCSTECCTTWHNRRRVEAKRQANLVRRGPCLHCGEEIPDNRRSDAQYCTRECMTLAVRARNYDADRARDFNRRYHYGISSVEFDELVASQGGVCAICGTSNWGKKGPCVDHCHKTGAVRGILCGRCNTGLGQFGDDPKRLLAAVTYLREAGRQET